MRTIEDTLGLWVSGLLTADQVIDWAGDEIARLDHPPAELVDLGRVPKVNYLGRVTAGYLLVQ